VDSPHEVLLIPPDADEETVEQAYRDRVKEAHPDQGGTIEEFQRVRAAYEALTNGTAEEWTADVSTTSGETGETESTEPPEQRGCQVEYLDYDVVTDHGWDVEADDVFAKAAAADLDDVAYGTFRTEPGESLLEAAERHDYAWPYACRGGACANCAVYIVEGDLSTPIDTVLPEEMAARGIRLSCNGVPTTDHMQVVFNVKHMPDLEDLLLPPRPWEQAHLD
jgi:ferredoxin